MTPKPVAPTSRMKPEDRRELVLDAAVRAFARGGYAGTSTDAVAKEAAVSQPYVVRIFGTKLDLFLEVFHRVMERIGTAFADELAVRPVRPGQRGGLEPARRDVHRAPCRPRPADGDDARHGRQR